MRNLIALYFPIALFLFCIFLGFFLADSSTPKNDAVSWMTLVVAAAFFPVVVPMAVLERLLKRRSPQPKPQPKLSNPITRRNLPLSLR
ncbi:MAG: hypothetical protein MUF49_27570 [Oculatellaceae cyanobacterium Prado106]|jgi:hypothetical protein|nr:hypothetical protein [Oculatellaceae cyanobacterium Prado106]